jgi:hypothetical protein
LLSHEDVKAALGARHLDPAAEMPFDRFQQHGAPLGVARSRSPQMPLEVTVAHEFRQRELHVRWARRIEQ